VVRQLQIDCSRNVDGARGVGKVAQASKFTDATSHAIHVDHDGLRGQLHLRTPLQRSYSHRRPDCSTSWTPGSWNGSASSFWEVIHSTSELLRTFYIGNWMGSWSHANPSGSCSTLSAWPRDSTWSHNGIRPVQFA